jgi:hypothetical protein
MEEKRHHFSTTPKLPGPDPWPRPGMQGLGLEPPIPVYVCDMIIRLCRHARAGWHARVDFYGLYT